MRKDGTYRVMHGVVQAQSHDQYDWHDLFDVKTAFLDPEAWKAVGKVEGWPGIDQPYQNGDGKWREIPWWQFNMHRLIDALAEGKTIEQYIETL